MTDAATPAPQKKRRSRTKPKPPQPDPLSTLAVTAMAFGGDIAEMAKAYFGQAAVAGHARIAVTGGREITLGNGQEKHRLLMGGVVVVNPADDTFSTEGFEFAEATVIIIPGRRRLPDQYYGRGTLDAAVTCLGEIDFTQTAGSKP